MWFFYDADGNPSGFKYQNGSTVYNYYYVCNWRGDVVALYANDGLKYTYEYDAWGKMLAIRNVSGEDVTGAANIANYNPLRYRGYYYDSETGLYYINSRYYDPQVKRFVNSDDDFLSSVSPQTLTNKNYFAYCDNNPVIRIDNDGEIWHVIVGAAFGVATQYLSDFILNLSNGQSFGEAVKPSSTWADYLSAAISGGLAATGIGLGASIAANAALGGATYLTNCAYKGTTIDKKSLRTSVVIGGVAGLIGGSGADGKNLRGVYSRSKQVLSTTKSINKQVMYKAKISSVKKVIVKSSVRTFAAGLFSKAYNFLGKMFLKK